MDSQEFELRLKDLELSIDRLRSLYEQYFRGLEKVPPNVLQKKVERNMRELRRIRLRNTAHRFRLQTQVQKYTTYLTYWQRIIRMLEGGQLKRGPAGLVPVGKGRKAVAPPAAPAAPVEKKKPRRAPASASRPPARGRVSIRPAPVVNAAVRSKKSQEKDELLDIDIDIDFG
jgi:hypothetical protein